MKAVDFFCGAGGMSFGLQEAGMQVLAGIDNAEDCRKTYTSNIVGAKFLKHDISTLSAPELGRRLGLKKNDPHLVFAGCSPCQFWSKIRTDKKKSQKSAFLLKQFQKFIRFFRPGFVVVENVPGLHRRKAENILGDFLAFLTSRGYSWSDGIVNASGYGVPQNRLRYLLVATRVHNSIQLPIPKARNVISVRSFIGVQNGFNALSAGQSDTKDALHRAAALSPQNLRRIAKTPKSGGDRSAWQSDDTLQLSAYRGRDDIFRDVYGRMYWDRPAPTITTRFNSLSNGRFGHPDENRAISLREGATLQTFPRDYVFFSATQTGIARQIGNAVPPRLAACIGRHLMRASANG